MPLLSLLKAKVMSVCCWIPSGYRHCSGTVEGLGKDRSDIMYLSAIAACVHWVTMREAERRSGYCWSMKQLYILSLINPPSLSGTHKYCDY